jgi:hypothetical protein
MLQTEIVVRALKRFRENRWNEVRTLDDLELLQDFVVRAAEPATSGVTGRVGHHDIRRRTPLNVLICRRVSFRGWLRSAWLSQPSDRRLGHEWATESCLQRQRLHAAL